MNSTYNETTVMSPSAQSSPVSGMPAHGHLTSAGLAVPAASIVEVSTCARTRYLNDMGIVRKGAFPGNRAWRPPSC